VIDLQRMVLEAGEDGESFVTVRSTPRYRLGVGARHPGAFFIEVIIELFPGGEVNIGHLRNCVILLSTLMDRGYELSCRDDRAVSAELALPMGKVEGEAAAVDVSARAALG
jgi:hypothetical protein